MEPADTHADSVGMSPSPADRRRGADVTTAPPATLVEIAAWLSSIADQLVRANIALVHIANVAALPEPVHVSDSVWLSSAQAAEHSHRTRSTVTHAAVNGDLHGHQATPGGKWVFHVEAIYAWIRGHNITCQREACGCDE